MTEKDRHTRQQYLNFDFWTRRFAANPAIIGREIVLKNQPFTVVGVTSPGFFGESVGRSPDIWVPLTWQPRLDRGMSLLDRPNVGWLRVMGRLRPDMTRDQAAAALGVSLARMKADPGDPGKFTRGIATIRVSDGSQGLEGFRERFALPLRILSGVVGVVLLIACANVSCLLLARATARRREVAIRLAIGAGRRRLVRQFLTESALLAGVGGAVGLLLAWWGSRVLLVLASSDTLPIPIDVVPNARTLHVHLRRVADDGSLLRARPGTIGDASGRRHITQAGNHWPATGHAVVIARRGAGCPVVTAPGGRRFDGADTSKPPRARLGVRSRLSYSGAHHA